MTTECELPSERALLAATLALMSAYAQPVASGRTEPATQRRLVAHKVVINLGLLLDHPALDAAMQGVLRQVHRHWTVIAGLPEAVANPVPACPASCRLH